LAAFIYGPIWFIFPLLLICLTLCVFEVALMLFRKVNRFYQDELLGTKSKPEDAAPNSQEKIKWIEKHKDLCLAVVAAAIGWAVFFGSTIAVNANERGGERGIIIFSIVVTILIGSFLSRSVEVAALRCFTLVISITYGALPWLAVWDLYLMGGGSRFIFLMLAIVWCGDTGAYFGGRLLGNKLTGQRKLAPAVSPNKTWEGAVCGLLASLAGGMLINLLYLKGLGSWELICSISIIAGIFAQLGDLAESTLKRFAGVKDSGFILPGHGGFLDRVDGLLFAAPVIWFILYVFT